MKLSKSFLNLCLLVSLHLATTSSVDKLDHDVSLNKDRINLNHDETTPSTVEGRTSFLTYFKDLGQKASNIFRGSSSSSSIGWKTIGSDLDGSFYYDETGRTVAINSDGTRIAIGSPGSLNERGYVSIYQWNDNTQDWDEMAILTGMNNDSSGLSLDMSSDGNSIIVGSPTHQNYYGTARVFEWIEEFNGWYQKGQDLDAEDRYDEGGESVSISGDGERVAVGAPESNERSGEVTVYELNHDTLRWDRLGSVIYGTDYYSKHGNSISLNYDGSTIVVGSELISSGYVKVFQYNVVDNVGEWSQKGSRILGSAADYEYFGHSVDINHAGDRVVISALNGEPDSNAVNTGMIQVFEFTNDVWEQLGSDIFGDASGDSLGDSVSMNGAGDRIVAGSSFADEGDVNAGQVKVYDYDIVSSDWVQVGDTILGECGYDQSGTSVGISDDGTRVIAGAPYNNYYLGHARVYEAVPGFVDYNNDHCFTVPQPTPTPTTKVPTTDAPTTTAPTPFPTTNVPTKSPTLSPTLSPTTSAPTLAPVVTCTSSPLDFVVPGYELDCSWAENDSSNCLYDGLPSHCPFECDACEEYACVDSEANFVYQNNEYFCSQLAALDPFTITHVCSNNPDVMATCRASCNFCG